MRLQWSCRAIVIAVVVGWLGSAAWPSRAEALSFGGQATGVVVTVPAAGITIKAASGELPPTGGEVEAALLSGDIPGSATGGAVSLAVGTLHSSAVGLDATDAEASQANIALTISSNNITADFLMAQSNARCGAGPAVAGSSQVANLVVNGQAITVTGAPNQTVSLPNGTATINEQVSSVVGTTGELRVNALHVTTIDPITGQVLADAVLAEADALIDCQPGSGPAGSATNGGGWIPSITPGEKATFGVIGAFQPDGSSMGHVVYIDHGAGFSLQSTLIMAFIPGCQGTAPQGTIQGQGNSNFGQVNFQVTVTDNGEPGTADTFEITVTGVYAQSGTLQGGNIQAHRIPCP